MPLLLRAFNIADEAQLAEAESLYSHDPGKFSSGFMQLNPVAIPVEETTGGDEDPLAHLSLPPPDSSMILPPIPTQGSAAVLQVDEESLCMNEEDHQNQMRPSADEQGEDEFVAIVANMVVQSTLGANQARGITIRDCSEQMLSNLDEALAMLAKLEFSGL